jgi:hypothetical protein
MNTTHDERHRPRRQALSAVQLLNLQFLVALRDAVRADPAQASYEYGIDVATADIVRHASDDGLRMLSYSADRALFTLRLRGSELAELLRKPPPLRGLLAAVRESKPNHRAGSR